MNKKIILMVLRILSLTKGTTGAESTIDHNEFIFPHQSPAIEMQVFADLKEGRDSSFEKITN